MSGRVIVVGSINVDLVVTTHRLPMPGETVTGGTFARHDGGKGGNQAAAAARLGVRAAMVAAVGDDAFGGEALAALEAEAVDVTGVAVLPGEATGTALIVVASGGENAIAVASGANARVTASMVGAALDRLSPGPGDVVLVGHEIPTAATAEALRRGRAAGATTILNPAPATGIDRSLFGLADVLTPNRGELAELCRAEVARTGARTADGRDVAGAARSLVTTNAEGIGPRAVLVSVGPAGAVLVTADGGAPVEIPAPQVRAVDATGAGDALNGALAAGLAAGLTLEVAARRAVAAASRSTEAPGARAGLPSAAELDGVEDAHPS